MLGSLICDAQLLGAWKYCWLLLEVLKGQTLHWHAQPDGFIHHIAKVVCKPMEPFRVSLEQPLP